MAFVRLIHIHAFRFIVIKRRGGGGEINTWNFGPTESRHVDFWRRRISARGILAHDAPRITEGARMENFGAHVRQNSTAMRRNP